MIGQLDCSNNPMLRASAKTRSVISLLAKVPGWDRLILSYRVQCSEIGTTLYVRPWNGNVEWRSCAFILALLLNWYQHFIVYLQYNFLCVCNTDRRFSMFYSQIADLNLTLCKEKSSIPFGGMMGGQNSRSCFSNSRVLTLRSPISF